MTGFQRMTGQLTGSGLGWGRGRGGRALKLEKQQLGDFDILLNPWLDEWYLKERGLKSTPPSLQPRSSLSPGYPGTPAGSWRGPAGGCGCPWWPSSAGALSASSPASAGTPPWGRCEASPAPDPAWCIQWPVEKKKKERKSIRIICHRVSVLNSSGRKIVG